MGVITCFFASCTCIDLRHEMLLRPVYAYYFVRVVVRIVVSARFFLSSCQSLQQQQHGFFSETYACMHVLTHNVTKSLYCLTCCVVVRGGSETVVAKVCPRICRKGRGGAAESTGELFVSFLSLHGEGG